MQVIGGKPESSLKYDMVKIAVGLGARSVFSNPGYAATLNAKARRMCSNGLSGYLHVETNITVEHKVNRPERVEAFHRVGSEQCKNIPDHIENLLVPAGSCNSLTSILYGLGRFKPKSLKKVILFRIMKNADEHREWTNQRLAIIEDVSGTPLRNLPYNFIEHDLVGTGYTQYSELRPFSFKDIVFHPRYEGKCLNFMRDNLTTFRPLLNENSLFWVVGSEPRQLSGLQSLPAASVKTSAQVPKSKRLTAGGQHSRGKLSEISTNQAESDIFYRPTGATHETPGRYCELMGIPEVEDLRVGMDFRRPEFRREVFLRFYEWSLRTRSFPGCVYFVMPYLYKRFKWNREERLWFAFLNGNTQNPVTSWLIFRLFPELPTLKISDLEKWFNKEFKRLAFDTDRRHQKSDFLESVKCYLKLTQGKQEPFFSSLFKTEDQHENFRKAWDVVRKQFYSFGRLASFSYLEYLRIMRVNLDCDQLFLEDLPGSKSHRNGLAKVLGRDDLDWHDSNPTGFDGKYTPEVMAWLKKEAALLLDEARQRVAGKPYAYDVSYFTLESMFCTYKSWHRPNRRYPGVYADMFHDRIKKAEAAWPEEDFNLFWDARKVYLPAYLRLEDNPGDVGVKPEKQNHYRLTGQVIIMDTDWPCFANSYRKSSKPASAQY